MLKTLLEHQPMVALFLIQYGKEFFRGLSSAEGRLR